MKKTYLLFCIMVSALVFCQETITDKPTETTIFDRKHELKVGAVKLLAGPILEVTYEYIYSKNFTYGSSILVNLSKNSDYPEDFSVTPFARFYFQETKEYGAKGFFVEGFAKYFAGNNNINYYSTNEKYSAGALGLALGKKWINSSGFVFETLIGFGRTLGGNINTPEAVFRGDLFLGYRF
ncbi:hypothetical protein [Flavobacterium cellulosilyticum]|uniref:DUF3575 domain-containing protein n=1 Tax=Flavobacterium cellulosilyticum TaxID=2541731 RepID=A0A4R5CI54_9FLAO|nr:hypothetical protein [Flavobacterium cellulosilyticum]TDD99861.1 hypothetical protein E0F76_03830 [Flavobacterium cellulosilyticum]